MRQCPCLFQLLAASGHQKPSRTAKHSAFQPASTKFVWVKIIQNQHKHIIGSAVAIVEIRHFLDPESYGYLYLPPHIILMILRFSIQPDSSHSQILRKAGQKKAELNKAQWQRVIYHRVVLLLLQLGTRSAFPYCYKSKNVLV